MVEKRVLENELKINKYCMMRGIIHAGAKDLGPSCYGAKYPWGHVPGAMCPGAMYDWGQMPGTQPT